MPDPQHPTPVVPGVTSPMAALLHFAAEAQFRKWSFTESSPEAFDALHRIGDEMRAAYDEAREAERAQSACAPPGEAGPGEDTSRPLTRAEGDSREHAAASWRDRAEAAEGKLAAITAHCEQKAAEFSAEMFPVRPQDMKISAGDILAIIGTEEKGAGDDWSFTDPAL